MAIRIPTDDSAPSVAFEDAVQLVFDALGEIPDFRDPGGKQIELRGTLALIVLAMAAGVTKNRRIAKWGVLREKTLIPLLGLCGAPSYSAIRRVVLGGDATAVRGVLRSMAAMILAEKRRPVTAKDGKVMPGVSAPDQRRAPSAPGNPLRTSSSRWQDDTPISQRALSAEYALTVEPETLLQRPP